MLYWYTFRPSFYALVYVCALFPKKDRYDKYLPFFFSREGLPAASYYNPAALSSYCLVWLRFSQGGQLLRRAEDAVSELDIPAYWMVSGF
jgi:hypothetical protein